jgi:hypothetical protein
MIRRKRAWDLPAIAASGSLKGGGTTPPSRFPPLRELRRPHKQDKRHDDAEDAADQHFLRGVNASLNAALGDQ